MSAPGGGNIKVVVRVRPFNTRETDRNAQCVVQMNNEQTIVAPPTGEHKPRSNKASLESAKTFKYDKSYWSFDRNDPNFAGQEHVFNDLGKPLLDNAFQGYNNCIFAYGQTGSGKSYSMMGFGAEPGVIPRICKEMFDRIDNLQQDKNVTCSVEVSYLEIYNERVRDLLNPATKGNLKVREHPSTGPYVEDLAKLVVRSFKEIENLMDEGNKARTVAATNMNETSSRSHAVFTLTLTQKTHDPETKMSAERAAKISLVDLAGSERATSTGATGARLKEGAEINRSLSTLGRVIAALADISTGKKKNSSMIPYRDSVLTWLLKDSLGGNSMTAMIAAISPADINFEETLSTLRYADSAKRIKNHAVVNEDANARMIRELKEELAQLRAQLGQGVPGAFPTGSSAAAPSNGADGTASDIPLESQMIIITAPDGSTKEVSRADVAEQLSQSEKLFTELNQTWEQKMQKTEEIHKEREAALEELGISIEKGFVGLSTPKKMPHLVNLSDDPLLAECLVYNLKPGNTTVGNDEMTTSAEIRLKGSKILKEHCVFENKAGAVTVVPNDDAAVMVNGMRINQAKRLHSGYRVILGDFHIFRFNHPAEARAERAEHGSLLKQAVTANDPDEQDDDDGGHHRTQSSLSYELEVPETDYDWSFARREAASAILGTDQKISTLTDEELDVLFEDVQRIRANRKGLLEDDTDSHSSYPVKTLDNFSLDTALTAPSTPPHPSSSSDYKAGTRTPSNQSEQDIQNLKAEMERQLQEQKDRYEKQIQHLYERSSTPQRFNTTKLSIREIGLARWTLQKWKQRKYVRMAGTMLQNASILKEAQILTQQMGKSVVFQYAIADVGHTLCSTYDLVLSGVADDEDDEDLITASKPCVCVRVTDFKHNSVYLWSLAKLEKRLKLMRQMQQYLDRPEYLQHFRLDNPFDDASLPQFTRIGEAQVSLSAVFESRVQDFTVDVVSPYTFNVLAILRMSLEPSLAEAPDSTLNFNVVMQDMVGFPEMEGTDVHAQLFLPRISEPEDGATTTQLINGFKEGPVRFDSMHGLSLPLSASRDSSLRVSLFSKVTSMHLDKLLSWDDMRDSSRKNEDGMRINENEFHTEEKHDVFVQAQILELTEAGEYEPVEVVSESFLDPGVYQLHQGLQRRVVIKMTHSCGSSLPWQDVTSFKAGHVHLLDAMGQLPELAQTQADVPLRFVSRPVLTDNPDGTSNVTIIGQWDSSAHGSLLLDRPTSDKYTVQVLFKWDVSSLRLVEPLAFSLDIGLQIRPRAFIRAPGLSRVSQLWNASKTVAHSTSGVFNVGIKPSPVKSAVDLWRMDTKYDYVKGEEELSGWTPRGVSLIRDYIGQRKRQLKAEDIEVTKSVFGLKALSVSPRDRTADEEFDEEEKELIRKMLQLWKFDLVDPGTTILGSQNIEPPRKGAAFAAHPLETVDTREASASVSHHPKNHSLSKYGHLLMPDPTQTRWTRRYLELRRPYLYVHSVPDGDGLNAINLKDSRVDHQPEVAQLLQRDNNSGKLHVFAIYARQNAFLFATRNEREKIEWVMRIDETYFNSNSNSGRGTPNGAGR